MTEPEISSITIYPIKGCRGQNLEVAEVTPMGLAGDREFTVLLDNQRVNQKQLLELINLTAQWKKGEPLRLGYPGKPDFKLDSQSGLGAGLIEVYSKPVPVIDMGDEVADWLSEAMGTSVRLARVKEAVNWFLPLPEFSLVDGEQQSKFVDIAPVLLTSQNSLDDLNRRLETPLPMNRFRPNIVITGLNAYQEDELPQFKFPGLTLNRVAVCERCIVTTTNQDTGERAKEPLRTLSQYRRRKDDYAGGIMFGMYLIPQGHGRISIGDKLTGMTSSA